MRAAVLAPPGLWLRAPAAPLPRALTKARERVQRGLSDPCSPRDRTDPLWYDLPVRGASPQAGKSSENGLSWRDSCPSRSRSTDQVDAREAPSSASTIDPHMRSRLGKEHGTLRGNTRAIACTTGPLSTSFRAPRFALSIAPAKPWTKPLSLPGSPQVQDPRPQQQEQLYTPSSPRTCVGARGTSPRPRQAPMKTKISFLCSRKNNTRDNRMELTR